MKDFIFGVTCAVTLMFAVGFLNPTPEKIAFNQEFSEVSEKAVKQAKKASVKVKEQAVKASKQVQAVAQKAIIQPAQAANNEISKNFNRSLNLKETKPVVVVKRSKSVEASPKQSSVSYHKPANVNKTPISLVSE